MIRVITKEMFYRISTKDINCYKKYKNITITGIDSTLKYLIYSPLDQTPDIPFVYYRPLDLVLSEYELSEKALSELNKGHIDFTNWSLIKVSSEIKDLLPLHIYRCTDAINYDIAYENGDYIVKDIFTGEEIAFSILSKKPSWSWSSDDSLISYIGTKRLMHDRSEDSKNEIKFLTDIIKQNGGNYKITNIKGE